MEPVNLGVTLELEGALTITQAPALRDLIANALHDNAHTIVDCSNATEADLTILQLLIFHGSGINLRL
jgi:anti-anti-sigma regulatory factor